MVHTIEHQSVREFVPDAVLVQRSLGDPRCFGTLFDRHAGAIYRYAVARVGPDRGEDVVADVFEIAFDRRAKFDLAATSARPWLYGIASNCLKKLGENERRWLERSALLLPDPHGMAETERSIARVDARQLAPAIAQALLELSPAERDVLVLHALEGLRSSEIADVLGIRQGAARTRLQRARAHLRDRLGNDDMREDADDA
jgi:RNA polymerase sigma-70 factor (ECF subfamily)